MAAFSTRMISHSVTAVALAKRRNCPVRHPSPKNWPLERNNGFLPSLRNDGDLHLSFLDIEHRIRRSALREDGFILSILGDGSAAIPGGEKYHRVKGEVFHLLCHYHSASRLACAAEYTDFEDHASSIL